MNLRWNLLQDWSICLPDVWPYLMIWFFKTDILVLALLNSFHSLHLLPLIIKQLHWWHYRNKNVFGTKWRWCFKLCHVRSQKPSSCWRFAIWMAKLGSHQVTKLEMTRSSHIEWTDVVKPNVIELMHTALQGRVNKTQTKRELKLKKPMF